MSIGNSSVYKIPTVVLNGFIFFDTFLAPSSGKQLDTNRFLIAALRNEPLLCLNI